MEKLRHRLNDENSNPVPNIRAIKSCQLQSIFHFYNVVLNNLCTKLTNTKNQLLLKATKHVVVNNSVCRSLQKALRAKSICKSSTNWFISKWTGLKQTRTGYLAFFLQLPETQRISLNISITLALYPGEFSLETSVKMTLVRRTSLSNTSMSK